MKKIFTFNFCCLMAVFSVQAQSYVKVTETPSDWSGDYLIVYEADGLAFNGGLEALDVASNTIAVTIADNAIEATDVVNAAKFTINASGNILSASGYYIGQTSNANGLKSSTSTTYTNTLSLNADGSVNIVSASAYLRYNATKDQWRFRYYKSSSYSNQKAIALYKYTETTSGGGEGGDTPDTPVVEAPAAPTLPAACNFDDAMTVEITGIAEGATAYYSLNSDTDWVEGTSVEITETTTVYAKVVKDELSSEVVSATYTKNVPVDPNAITETIVASETGIDNGVAVESLTFGNVTATFDKGTNSNPTKYYTSGTAFRAYGGNTITFTGDAGVTINSVVFEFGSSDGSNAITADCGTYSEGTWTGASNKVVFTIGGSTGNRRLAKITVVYSIQEGVVVISTPSIAGEETFVGSTTVEITNNAESTTLYYSTDGVDYKEYTVAFTIDATTTVYAYAQDGEGNKSSVAEATFTEMEIISIADAKAAYDAASANVAVAMDITGAVVTVNSGQYMFIETAEAGINIYNSGADYAVGTKFTTGYILGESAVYGKMHQITNAEFYDVATEAVEVTPKDVTIAELNADFDAYEGRYVRLTGVNINDKTITQGEDTYALYNRFDFITAPTVAANCDIVAVVARYNTTYQVFPVSISNSVDVTAAGYATLYLGYPVAIPVGVEAYVVSAVNDGWVALEQVTGVLPAETGVIVKAGQGAYEFVYSADEAATISSLLKGTVAAENVTPVGTAYVLSAPAGVVGLYIAELAEGAFLNNANKAYLDVTNSNDIASYSFNFDWNGTTGVEGVVAEGAQNGAIYDITGRRVKAITAPGIYIVNGKKVVK